MTEMKNKIKLEKAQASGEEDVSVGDSPSRYSNFFRKDS